MNVTRWKLFNFKPRGWTKAPTIYRSYIKAMITTNKVLTYIHGNSEMVNWKLFYLPNKKVINPSCKNSRIDPYDECKSVCTPNWATGKTLIAKCDLGSKLSFSGVRYIVLQCFLPPSKRSPLKCMQEHFSQRHVRFCSVFHCFALILLVRIDRLKSKDFSYEPFDFWGIHHVKAFYAEMVIVWLSFWLSFNPM